MAFILSMKGDNAFGTNKAELYSPALFISINPSPLQETFVLLLLTVCFETVEVGGNAALQQLQ